MSADELKQVFGLAIKSQRSELGMSQEQLADRAGLHRTYVSDVERGTRNLSIESIEKLAQALRLSVATLFERALETDGVTDPVEILLVEDDAADVELTRRAFLRARLANPLHVVSDGVEALDFLFARGRHAHRSGARLPGVILLDLNLPRLGGVEVLRRIKSDPRTHAVPVVILTASREDQTMTECRKLGVASYIVKPVDFHSFSAVVPELSFEWRLTRRGTEAA